MAFVRKGCEMLNRNLVAMLKAQDKKLAAALDESRSSFQHAGLRGDAVESAFRDFLSKHLPRHFTVGTGEVIDLGDHTSSQTDVIVANVDQPFQTGLHEPGIFLIEGVSAAGEIKSKLTLNDLNDTLNKGAKFKTLRNTTMNGTLTFTNPSDESRFYRCPPYFLFATESVVALQTLQQRLEAAMPVPSANGEGPDLPPLDAVFILGRGAALNLGDGEGDLKASRSDGTRLTGWTWVEGESVIAEFLIWLTAVAPRPIRNLSPATDYLLRHRASLKAMR
ncbi:DUF6602 domain-containing protein [Streptomyces sp. NPDC056296]|uniref:DUF6602 domain-containing protein n=1 Tax=Streptomyces sp. NPDC056296 TaxID=3345775 RepID=UPI0035D840FC